MATDPILSVRGLSVDFVTSLGTVRAVERIAFDVRPGEIVGVVGESGSGKSVTMTSILRLLPEPPARISGRADLAGHGDLLKLPPAWMRQIRGNEIALIPQDPMTSLNPVLTVGFQIAEAIRLHDTRRSRKEAFFEAIRLLELVEVPDAPGRARQYPHEFSGGMRQRAMIAMSIANKPRIIIADEPTTALDVTVQAHVLEVLRKVQKQTDAGMIFITHDLGVVAELASRVIVMYAGRIVEEGDVRSLFHHPRHPYTAGLLKSLPRIQDNSGRLEPIPGQSPSARDALRGCVFQPRCTLSRGRSRCLEEVPRLEEASGDRRAACHFSAEMAATNEGWG